MWHNGREIDDCRGKGFKPVFGFGWQTGSLDPLVSATDSYCIQRHIAGLSSTLDRLLDRFPSAVPATPSDTLDGRHHHLPPINRKTNSLELKRDQ